MQRIILEKYFRILILIVDICEMRRIILEKYCFRPYLHWQMEILRKAPKLFFSETRDISSFLLHQKVFHSSVLNLFRFTKFLLTKKNMYCNISPNCLIRSVWRFWKRHFKQNFSKKFNSGVFYANCKDWCLFHCLKTSIYYHIGKKNIEHWELDKGMIAEESFKTVNIEHWGLDYGMIVEKCGECAMMLKMNIRYRALD